MTAIVVIMFCFSSLALSASESQVSGVKVLMKNADFWGDLLLVDEFNNRKNSAVEFEQNSLSCGEVGYYHLIVNGRRFKELLKASGPDASIHEDHFIDVGVGEKSVALLKILPRIDACQ